MHFKEGLVFNGLSLEVLKMEISVSSKVSEGVHRQLKHDSAVHGITISELIRRKLEDDVETPISDVLSPTQKTEHMIDWMKRLLPPIARKDEQVIYNLNKCRKWITVVFKITKHKGFKYE